MPKTVKEKIERGEMASSERAKNQGKRKIGKKIALIFVKYKDHVLFRNCDSSKIKPAIRTVVGWVVFENAEGLVICSDLPVKRSTSEKSLESGFLILKSDIIERHELGFGKAFMSSCLVCFGHKLPYNREN